MRRDCSKITLHIEVSMTQCLLIGMITQTLRMEKRVSTDEIEGLKHRNIVGMGFLEIKQK